MYTYIQVAYRQHFFPSRLIVAALSSKLQAAHVTVSKDRNHLLNALIALHQKTLSQNQRAIDNGAIHLQRLVSIDDAHHVTASKEQLAADPPAEAEAYMIFNALLMARLASETDLTGSLTWLDHSLSCSRPT